MTPPWYRLQDSSLAYYPPGPTYIAGALERIGYDSVVYNADYDPDARTVVGGTNILNTEELSNKYHRYLKNLNDPDHPVWHEVRRALQGFAPDVLGISAYTSTLKAGLNVARIAKELNRDTITVFGGLHPTIDPEGTLKDAAVDYAVIGEGEFTVQELVKAIDAREKDLSGIKGIAYRENGSIRINEKRELAPDIDQIVSVARHKLFQKELCPPFVFHMVYAARGCPYFCVYCDSHNLWGRKKRSRSAASLLDEIERTHKDYKTRYFYICDDVFFFKDDIPRAYEFCEGLLKRRLKIFWSTQTRAETINEKTRDLLSLMKKTGGQHISVGIETGSDRISKLIRKGNSIEQVRKAARIIRKNGLYLSGFFMFGFPWETEAEIQQTLDLLKETDPAVAFPYIATPAPGTELNKIAIDLKLIPPTLEPEKFYHENPEMGLSVNIPPEKKTEIVNRVLSEFSKHNRAKFRRLAWRRLPFYYALMHDYAMFRNLSVMAGYFGEVFKQRGEKMKSLKDKIVIITGASSGIGRSCAFEFAKNGACLYLVSRNAEKLEKLCAELRKKDPEAKVHVRIADVGNERAITPIFGEIAKEAGRIDVLVNNAGIGLFAKIGDTSSKSFDEIMRTNVGGVFYCTREAIPHMKRQQSGHIVNIASVVAYRGFPGMGVYSASKAAVKAFSEALRLELEKDNIGVTLVSPGATATAFAEAGLYEGNEKHRSAGGMSPQEVAQAVILGIQKNKKEVVLSREGLIIGLLNRFAPFLLDPLIRMTQKK